MLEVVVDMRLHKLFVMLAVCAFAWSLLAPPLLVADESSPKAKAHYEAGMSRKRAQEYAAAIAEFRKAVEVTPGYVDAWWGLAWSCVAAERKPDAIEAFGHVVELVPGTERARGARAALQRLGDAPPPGAQEEVAPDAEPDGPAVFVKEGGKLFHCDHGCPSIHTRLMGIRRKSYPDPLAAAREGSRPCPQCKPVPEGMMAAVREVVAELERRSKRPQPVTCDQFKLKVQWEKPGKELVVSLDTDLPGDAEVQLAVSRDFWFDLGSHATADYFSQPNTVESWRTPRLVQIDEEVWDQAVMDQIIGRRALNAAIERLAIDLLDPALLDAQLSTDVFAVSSDIQVIAVFNIRQPDSRVFEKGNLNVRGQAMGAYSEDPAVRLAVESLWGLRGWLPAEVAAFVRDFRYRIKHGGEYYALDDVSVSCPYNGIYQ